MNGQESPVFREYALETELDTERLGIELARRLERGSLVILEGKLGAGKTFLAGAILHALGLDREEAVTSPTYSLVTEYLVTECQVRLSVAHADLYRLTDLDEVLDLGLEERRHQGFVLLVEWGKPYVDALGGDALLVVLNTDPRRVILRPSGPDSTRILQALPEALTPTQCAD
jgi:tRNA threonylcarbamoyladenosine biosynthesis protein TsaE